MLGNYVKGLDLMSAFCYKPAKFVIFDEGRIKSFVKPHNCGLEQLAARLAHNQQVGGANPSPATKLNHPLAQSVPALLLGKEAAFGRFFYAEIELPELSRDNARQANSRTGEACAVMRKLGSHFYA